MENQLMLLKDILSNPSNRNNIYYEIKRNSLLDYVNHITSFLNTIYVEIPWAQRFWHINNDILDLKRCKGSCCNKIVKYNKSSGYQDYCTQQCANSANKIKLSENYRNPEKRSIILEKHKQTCKEKYGVEYYMKASDYKEKRDKTYNNKHKEEKKLTSFLDEKYVNVRMAQRMWHIDNSILKLQQCKNPKCDNIAKWHNGHGYVCCSKECSNIVSGLNIKANYDISGGEIQNKARQTFLSKYGVDNPSKLDIKKGKNSLAVLSSIPRRVKTCLEKYGVSVPSKADIIKNKVKRTRIEKGLQFPDILLKPFTIYHKKVWAVTNRYKKKLYEGWDGTDYYTKEYIKNNIEHDNHSLRPSLDHKISIYLGFMNNIDHEIIGGIANLCITTRSNNSSKCIKSEDDYMKILENKK